MVRRRSKFGTPVLSGTGTSTMTNFHGRRWASAFFSLGIVSIIAAHATVTVETDRFTQNKTVSMGPIHPVAMQMQMYASAVFKSSSKIPVIELYFMGSAQTWKYLQCHSVHFLADGKPVDVPEAGHHGEVMSGGVIEMVRMLNIDLETMRKLSEAKLLEYKICADEFKASPMDWENLKGFVSKIDELAK